MRGCEKIKALIVLLAVCLSGCDGTKQGETDKADSQPPDAALFDNCTQCHRWTPPEVLPRRLWRRKIQKMYQLANETLLASLSRPIEIPLERTVAYFEGAAPEEIDAQPWTDSPEPGAARFLSKPIGEAAGDVPPGIANVRLLMLDDGGPPILVACDMLTGWVSWGRPDDSAATLERLAHLSHPGHVEAVDLDQDGQIDLLVAELGSATPTDDRVGGVVWLRRIGHRKFETVRLLSDAGRVADVQAADFDGDGDLDLIVAEFGWIRRGSLLYLENTAGRAGGPVFAKPTVLDERHGAIHVPIVDLDGDGRPDFVALFAQGHESVVAFLNRSGGRFETQDLFVAPHPHWGSSGIEPVDLDQDGDIDFLITNGDTLDDEIKFKPYQGVGWLENEGMYPFTMHWIGTYYGVHRAEAGDLDGDGDLDIAASSFLPGVDEARRKQMNLPGVVWFEQQPGLTFQPHTIADVGCDHATLDIADVDGDGRLDVITGALQLGARSSRRTPVEVWLNRARAGR